MLQNVFIKSENCPTFSDPSCLSWYTAGPNSLSAHPQGCKHAPQCKPAEGHQWAHFILLSLSFHKVRTRCFMDIPGINKELDLLKAIAEM